VRDLLSKPFSKLKRDEVLILRRTAEERFDFFNAYFLDTALQPFHQKWVEFQLGNSRTLILGPRACWKCASANSLIPTTEGLAYFKDFLPVPTKLPFVESVDNVVGSCLGLTKATRLFCNGISDVLEIVTEDGFTLQVTPEHRLLVWDGGRLAFNSAGALSVHDQILFRCDWRSFAAADINPFNVPSELWFSALAYFYVAYPNWQQIWQQKHLRKTIARPLWKHFKHARKEVLPKALEDFLDSFGFGSHLIPKPLRWCTAESARVIAEMFWWLNQFIKFSDAQACEVQNWFLNLGLPLRRVGPTLTHMNASLRNHFHQFLRGTYEFKYSEEQIIELAGLTFLEVTCSSFVPPLLKFKALQMGRKGFTNKPTLATQFVGEFLQHAPKLRRFAFMFRFPFFLQRVAHVGEFETLTLDFTTTEGNYLINGAVGHNSTVCGKNYGIWRALKNPNIRIGIISKSSLLSSMFVSQIKHILETNSRINYVWSDLIQPKKAQKWNNSEVTLIRPMSLANATFTAMGVGTSLAGHHFDILIFDDVVDTDHQMSPSLRKRLWDWFRFVAMQTLSVAEETQAHIIGTLYHPDDLYHHIIRFEREGRGSWSSLVQPAINEDGTSFWEEMFPLSALQEIEATYGHDVFQLQYQNDPDFGSSGITWDMFEANYYEPENINPDLLEVVIGVDLAAPEAERRHKQSSFAIVVAGLERQTNKIFVLDILKRTSVRMADQRAFIENFYSRYRHTSTIQIEAYAVQSYFHEYLGESEIVLPYAKVQTGGSKEARFDHVLNLLASNRLYFRAHLHNELLEEIINFPNTSADLIDSLYLAIKGFHREPKLRFLNW